MRSAHDRDPVAQMGNAMVMGVVLGSHHDRGSHQERGSEGTSWGPSIAGSEGDQYGYITPAFSGSP